MNKGRAEQLGGKLSFPSKMDCPASTCRVGSILAQQPDSTCADCYAAKGTFRFKNVKGILEDNYEKLWNPEWTPAILAQIRWEARDRFRWFMSGDLQGENHLRNIIQICDATRHLRHWLPTREIAVVLA